MTRGLVVLALGFLLLGQARAAGYAVYSAGGGMYKSQTAAGSCAALVAATKPGGTPAVGAQGGECDSINTPTPDGNHYNVYAGNISRGCSDGSGSCEDAPPPHPCGPAGTTISHPDSEVMQLPDGTAPSAVCDNGCTAVPAHTSSNNMGNTYAHGDTIGTGHSCGANAAAGGRGPADPASGPAGVAAPDATPAPTDAAKCVQAGSCPGTVNGTTVCVACGSSGTGGASATTNTSPTGQQDTSITTTSTATTSSGTTSTTSTTTKSDGSSSVTTTAGAGGSKGGGGAGAGGGPCTGTDCGSSDDSFGGSCSSSFTCSGDAVQCAIAKEQHIRSCLLFEPSTQGGEWSHGAETLAKAKTDGDVPSWSPAAPGNAVENNFDWQSKIDHTATLAATCPADVSIGSSGLVLPLSQLCPYLGLLGTFIEAMTAIACAFILFKGTK